MEYVKITLNDGTIKECPKDTTYYELSKSLGKEKDTIAVRVNNEVFPLDAKIRKDENVELLDVKTLSGYKIYQSGLKFLFIVAVSKLFPESIVHFLHSVPKGILCEIDMPHNITGIDVSNIKREMAKIVDQKERTWMLKKQANILQVKKNMKRPVTLQAFLMT
mgnify:CR=1 FL=1